MTGKHTPGPWHYEPPGTRDSDDESGFYAGVECVMNFGRSCMGDVSLGVHPSDADAELIAAAPALADALEALVGPSGDLLSQANLGCARIALRLAGRLP